MTEQQRLFLVQSRTDFAVYELLRSQTKLPHCHALHYLQMATELLGKAYAWKRGVYPKSHRAFVSFVRSLSTNRKVQQKLGFADRKQSWTQRIEKSVIPLAQRIEDLAPTLAGERPNPEYPWPGDAPEIAPAEHSFDIWYELQKTTGRKFISVLERLFASAESFL